LPRERRGDLRSSIPSSLLQMCENHWALRRPFCAATLRLTVTSDRREFLSRMAISGLALQSFATKAAGSGGNIKAVAFDGFPILDPRPVFALVDELYPERGVELGNLWRTRQFEYTWLRTMSGRYTDFWQVTDDALVFAAKALKVELTPEKHARLMEAYLKLRCWPDVPAALSSLKKAGIRIAFLSNLTAKMLESGIQNSQLGSVFDHVLSTDRVKVYKPDPRAYQMGLDAFGLKPDQILFAAFAGWDAAGAKLFGYPTFWVNRQNQPAEELGAAPDASGGNLNDLVAFLVERGNVDSSRD
jgi:2-haloacid dehalogenase